MFPLRRTQKAPDSRGRQLALNAHKVLPAPGVRCFLLLFGRGKPDSAPNVESGFDFLCILARNCEGTEQLRKIYFYPRSRFRMSFGMGAVKWSFSPV